MKGLANYPSPVSDKHITVCDGVNWMTLDPNTTHITVGRNCSSYRSQTVLDLSRFLYLKELVVGDGSFMYVNEVKLVGLHYLESVVIGEYCFRHNGHFALKNCPTVKSLIIGEGSFSDYNMIEIENVNALEVIEMDYSCFFWVSLELKSILIHNE